MLGGVPRRGIYDNMKTAVDKVRRGKERDVNARFRAMVSHYLFEPEFCNPASGWEKGQVEKNVRMPATGCGSPCRRSRTWPRSTPGWNSAARRCGADIPHGKLKRLRRGLPGRWSARSLMHAPRPFDGFVEHTKRVSPTCLVTFERNRYSVPASFANRPVSLRVYADRLVVAAEGNIICEHHARSSTVATTRPARRSTTGGTTWRCCSASPARCATAHRSWNCRRPFGRLQAERCSSSPAATGRWSRSWRWCCITTSRPC